MLEERLNMYFWIIFVFTGYVANKISFVAGAVFFAIIKFDAFHSNILQKYP